MRELKKQISKLVGEELERAMHKEPLFTDCHHGHNIIREEIEEAQEEMVMIEIVFNQMWMNIRTNKKENAIYKASEIKELAINAAAELVQVAAMCQKFEDSLKEDKNE